MLWKDPFGPAGRLFGLPKIHSVLNSHKYQAAPLLTS